MFTRDNKLIDWKSVTPFTIKYDWIQIKLGQCLRAFFLLKYQKDILTKILYYKYSQFISKPLNQSNMRLFKFVYKFYQ